MGGVGGRDVLVDLHLGWSFKGSMGSKGGTG
jgi:hypothetical protein